MTARRRVHRGGVGGHEPFAVVTARADRAWELEAAGRTQREIAAELGISQPAVSKILRRMAMRVADEWRRDQNRARIRALNREEYLYRESVRAFERSQQDQTTRRQRQITNAQGGVTQALVEVNVRARDGDPRFLDQAGRAAERVAALNGLVPHGHARSTVDGDAHGARERVARQLGRLAAAAASALVDQSTQ